MSKFGIPSQGRDPLAYADTRLSGVPTVDAVRDPTINDTNYPIQTIWRNNQTFKECMLVGFTGGEAQWKCFTDADGSVLELKADDDLLVQPNGGVIDIDGIVVANATNSKPLFTEGSTANTMELQLQIGTAVSPTPVDANDAGILSANNNQFVVDSTSGMFSLKGDPTNQAVQSVDVDANTAPGTDPVLSSATGEIGILGSVVAAHSVPVETHSRSANNLNVEVQVASAVTGSPGNKNAAGLVQFDDSQFMTDTDGYTTLVGTPPTPDAFSNLGMTYDSGTGIFTITDSDQNTLSASNPAFVTLHSKATPGKLITYSIETPYTFTDANGTSDITGNLFGLTTGIATDQDIPFFLYFVSNDSETEVTPFITRAPFNTYSPTAANLGKPSSAIADQNLDGWILDDSVTVGDYDQNPTVRVGHIRMRMDGSDDWTIQDLDFSPGNLDGINVEIAQRNWIMPSGQFGASSGSFFNPNGGTAPIFTNQKIAYTFLTGQSVLIRYDFSGDGGNTDGAGAVDAQMVLPFMALQVNSGANVFSNTFVIVTATVTQRIGIHQLYITGNYLTMSDYAGTTITLANFGNGTRVLRGQVLYRLGGS